MIELVLGGILGYLLGAVPTGVLVCQVWRGVDVREHESGHTGGLNVSRVAGLAAGVITAVVDLLLGVGAVVGAMVLWDDPWVITVAGVMAVVGHNWSIFVRFGGGIGLSTLVGALLGGGMIYQSPWAVLFAAVIAAACWFLLIKFLRVHRARATIAAMVIVGPLLWALGGSTLSLQVILLGVLGGVVVIIKTTTDWNRQYKQ